MPAAEEAARSPEVQDGWHDGLALGVPRRWLRVTPKIGESWWREGENVFVSDVIGTDTDYFVCYVNELGKPDRLPLAAFTARYRRGWQPA